jgi:hypothetical protein
MSTIISGYSRRDKRIDRPVWRQCLISIKEHVYNGTQGDARRAPLQFHNKHKQPSQLLISSFLRCVPVMFFCVFIATARKIIVVQSSRSSDLKIFTYILVCVTSSVCVCMCGRRASECRQCCQVLQNIFPRVSSHTVYVTHITNNVCVCVCVYIYIS